MVPQPVHDPHGRRIGLHVGIRREHRRPRRGRPGTAAGALSTYQSATNTSSLYLTDLASWLKAVPGSMIVLLESCGSGAGVYQNANGGTTRVGFFDAKAAIEVFAAADTEIVTEETLEYFYDETGEPLVTEDGTPIVNVGEFRVANKFYVLTASDYLENSVGMAEDFQTTSGSYNVFPYYIKEGVGTSGSMPADNYSSYGNGDGKLTLNELYHYVYDYSLSKQHTLVYPTNSSFVLFKRYIHHFCAVFCRMPCNMQSHTRFSDAGFASHYFAHPLGAVDFHYALFAGAESLRHL